MLVKRSQQLIRLPMLLVETQEALDEEVVIVAEDESIAGIFLSSRYGKLLPHVAVSLQHVSICPVP